MGIVEPSSHRPFGQTKQQEQINAACFKLNRNSETLKSLNRSRDDL